MSEPGASASSSVSRPHDVAPGRFSFRRLPVRAKLLLSAAVVFAASCLFIAYLAESALERRLHVEVDAGLDALAAAVAAGEGAAVASGAYEVRAADSARAEAQDQRTVVDQKGQHWVISRPVSPIPSILRELRVALVLGGASALIALFLILFVATGYFTRRLERLVHRARHLDHSDEDAPVRRNGEGDEIAMISGSFDRMEGDLRKALRSLAKERDRFRTALFNMDEAVFSLKHDGRIRLANRAALALLRREDGDVTDVPITDLLQNATLVDLLGRREAIAPGSVATAEFALDGPMRRQVLARFTPHHETRGSSLVLVDVTNMRRLETLRQDFVANVSHELRTPVAVLLANIETLLDGALSDEVRAKHFLEGMRRNVDRLARLVADLLDLARIESGAFEPKLAPVRISDVVGAVADGLEGLLLRRETEIRLSLEDNLVVRAEGGGLEQILVNLVENAVKYSPQQAQVRIAARRVREGWVEITVADNGPGIPEMHRARIFERFYRVDPGRSKEMGGTGLGLAIVKHLAGAFGGTVSARENQPQGTVFAVELPEWDAAPVL